MKQALSGKLTFLDNRSNNKGGFFYKVLYLQGAIGFHSSQSGQTTVIFLTADASKAPAWFDDHTKSKEELQLG